MKKVRLGSRPSRCEIMFLSFWLSSVHSFPPPAFLLYVRASLCAGSISRCILFYLRGKVSHTHTHTHNTGVFVFSTLFNQKRQTSLITAGLKLVFTEASGPDFPLISVLSFFWGTVWFQQITSLSGNEQLISLWLSVLLQLLSIPLKRTTVSGYNAWLERINIS